MRFERSKFIVTVIYSIALGLMLLPLQFSNASPLTLQDDELSEMEIMERVASLQRKLESQQIPDRDQAEKDLEALGPRALDHLEPEEIETSDGKERLQRVRIKLEKLAAKAVTVPSTVTLSGNMSLEEILKGISRQTKNDVGFRDGGAPDEISQQTLDVDFKKASFWEVMDDVLKRTDLDIDPYAGEPGQLRIGQMARPNVDPNNPQPPVKKPTIPTARSGIFSLKVTRIDSSRNLLNPQLNYSNLSLQVRWEPRIRPISVDLPMKSVIAIDEFDNKIEVTNPEAVMSGMVQPEIPELEFALNLGLVDRQIEEIKELTATIDAILPGRIETFRFKKIGQQKAGAQQRRAGAIVTFKGVDQNEDLFGVTTQLEFDEQSKALESHQGWAFQNEMYMLKPDGERVDFIGMETIVQDVNRVSVQYFFGEDPKDWTMVYKTPAAIVQLPIKIKFTKIPLP